MTDTLGWYGKLPGLGDFAQRRLPADFVALWDAWLQEGITHRKAVFAETWLDSHASDRFARRDQLISLRSWEGSSVRTDCLAGLASCALQHALASYSLWWCHAANGLSGGFAHRSLPTASFLTKMITYSPAESGDHSHQGSSGG